MHRVRNDKNALFDLFSNSFTWKMLGFRLATPLFSAARLAKATMPIQCLWRLEVRKSTCILSVVLSSAPEPRRPSSSVATRYRELPRRRNSQQVVLRCQVKRAILEHIMPGIKRFTL